MALNREAVSTANCRSPVAFLPDIISKSRTAPQPEPTFLDTLSLIEFAELTRTFLLFRAAGSPIQRREPGVSRG